VSGALNWSAWRRGLSVAYAAIVVLLLAWVLIDQLPEARRTVSTISWRGVCAFVLCWIVMALYLGALWAASLRILAGVRLPATVVIRVQGWSWAGRYLPAKMGLLIGKLTLAAGAGLNTRQIVASVLFEQFAFVLSGFVVVALIGDTEGRVASLIEPLAGRDWRAWWPPLVGAGAAIGLGVAAVLALRTGGRALTVRTVSAMLGLGVLHGVSHGVCGLGVYLVARETALGADFLHALAASTLANVSGALAFFAPSGLGVREGVLAVWLTAPGTSLTPGLALAAALRLLTLVADVIVLLLAVVAGRHAKMRPPTSDQSA
jgi:hypothetical protein